ncbi:C39 family peptidase, partial [Patescibacteria group bacterium]
MLKRIFLIFKTGLILGVLFLIFLGIGISKIEAKNLTVPRFSQINRNWAHEQLGYSNLTIGSHGCAVTSKAMIFNYYQKGFTNPSELNRYLKKHGGYSGASMIWGNVGTPSGVSYQGVIYPNRNVIKQKTNQGYPLLAQVWTSNRTMHFVIITGVSGSRYLINDSWDGKKTSLRGRGYTLVKTHFYKGKVRKGSYSRNQPKKSSKKSKSSLRITQGLWLKNYKKAYAGEPFDAQFVVKNFSKKTIKVKNLSIFVRGPRGQNLDLGGSGRVTLRPGKSYRVFKKTNRLGRYNLTGIYRFGCSYQDSKGKWHLLTIGRKGAVNKRNLRVYNPKYHASYLKNLSSVPSTISSGEMGKVILKFKNTGTATWYRDGKNAVRLGTWNKQDHHSKFFESGTWCGKGRIKLQQKIVRPGKWGSFVFNLKIPEVQEEINQKETFRLVCERRTWFNHHSQVVLSFQIQPDGDLSFRDDFDDNSKIENLNQTVVKNSQVVLDTWKKEFGANSEEEFDQGNYL